MSLTHDPRHAYIQNFSIDNSPYTKDSLEYMNEISAIFARFRFLVDILETESYGNKDFAAYSLGYIEQIENDLSCADIHHGLSEDVIEHILETKKNNCDTTPVPMQPKKNTPAKKSNGSTNNSADKKQEKSDDSSINSAPVKKSTKPNSPQ
jgi:hypothetical protein